ncbi:MAG TPA: 4Fe-4S dicluster domain-containing protein [Thermoproteota archaeon]|nr:4Fe-4S dicluster domain-containing protein [Thermoproteota archaeon]
MALSQQKTRKIIVCDTDKCDGCQVCEFMCSIAREKTTNQKKSRIRAMRIEPFFNIAIACRKCEKPVCERACPRDAIRVLSDGSIQVDKDKCNGCGWCIESCEFGALRLRFDGGVAFTCDFCGDLGEPQCVKYCPKKALKYITLEEAAKESVKDVLLNVIDKGGE